MDLTDDQIADLKSLVRVGMDMHDIENWHNGEYSGDAGKFTDGAMIGIDLWVKQLCASQKTNTNDSALPISDVVFSETEVCNCKEPYVKITLLKCTKCDRLNQCG
mgnify:FL=1|tara:strand:+ start:29 stop:343 length:315 start_codon:yes stop_codon:yes gene_type:complete